MSGDTFRYKRAKEDDDRYVVLLWRKGRDEDSPWKMWRATLVHSLRMAKRLKTANARYWNIRVSIIPEQILEGIGELSTPDRTAVKKKLMVQNLASLPTKGRA